MEGEYVCSPWRAARAHAASQSSRTRTTPARVAASFCLTAASTAPPASSIRSWLPSRVRGHESTEPASRPSPHGPPAPGPAVLAYNDAEFSGRDFEAIQRIGDSLKKEERTGKTGRFGVGFNAGARSLSRTPRVASPPFRRFRSVPRHRRALLRQWGPPHPLRPPGRLRAQDQPAEPGQGHQLCPRARQRPQLLGPDRPLRRVRVHLPRAVPRTLPTPARSPLPLRPGRADTTLHVRCRAPCFASRCARRSRQAPAASPTLRTRHRTSCPRSATWPAWGRGC